MIMIKKQQEIRQVRTAVLEGIDASIVEVSGLPPGDAARVVVRQALKNAIGAEVPRDAGHVGPVQRAGTDLAYAVSFLPPTPDGSPLDGAVYYADLSLDGTLREVRGTPSVALAAQAAGARALVIAPGFGTLEAAVLAPKLRVLVAENLRNVYRALADGSDLRQVTSKIKLERFTQSMSPSLQEIIDRVTGLPRLLLVGPPGNGKTIIAQHLRNTLPDLEDDEAKLLIRIRSASGLGPLFSHDECHVWRLFRAPHHSTSMLGIMGGSTVQQPVRSGEVTLAHGGVLYLDELQEFSRPVIESLGKALRLGTINFGCCSLPARPAIVVASALPCPCGFHDVAGTARTGGPGCRCTPEAIRRYEERLRAFADQLNLRRFDVGKFS